MYKNTDFSWEWSVMGSVILEVVLFVSSKLRILKILHKIGCMI